MPAPIIDSFPPAPSMSDSKRVFNQKATAWVAAMEQFTAQINAFGEYLNTYTPPGSTVFSMESVSPYGGVGTGSCRFYKVENSDGTGLAIASGTIDRPYSGATNVYQVPAGYLGGEFSLYQGVGTPKGAGFSGSTLPSAVYYNGFIQIRDATSTGQVDFLVAWHLANII